MTTFELVIGTIIPALWVSWLLTGGSAPATGRRPAGYLFPILGTVLLAAGLGFTVWARRHLGRNWSASVVVKEDHALVRTGPYRYLRHPIYTGILLAFLGMVVAIGEVRGLVALAFAAIAFVVKSRAEEARMRATFPEYNAYAQQTSAIIPYVY